LLPGLIFRYAGNARKTVSRSGADGRQWSKAVATFESKDESVTVHFDDGSSATGRLLVACDGGNSRIRRALYPERQSYKILIRVMGVKAEFSPEQMEPLWKLDPVFFKGQRRRMIRTHSSVVSSMPPFLGYDSPGNHPPRTQNDLRYVLQLISWPFRPGFLDKPSPTLFPATKEASIDLIKTIAKSWTEPFYSLANNIPPTSEIKHLELYDWLRPKEVQGVKNIALVGNLMLVTNSSPDQVAQPTVFRTGISLVEIC